ncbi:DUF3667 domain-containing protein [soil metagenome]
MRDVRSPPYDGRTGPLAAPASASSEEERCPNCGTGPIAAYCAACGERQPSHADYSARAVALEVGSEFLSVDGRFWRSIVALLSKPGLLTKEYFSGRRGRYMRPFSLFILLNVAFFFAQPYTGLLRYSYAEYSGVDGLHAQGIAKQKELFLNDAHFAERFDDTLQDQKKSLLLVAIPVFALSLMALYARSGRVYVEHLVFAVHSYAFMVFYLTAMGTVWFSLINFAYRHVPWARPAILPFTDERGVILVLGAGMLWYFTVALRRFYGSALIPALSRAFVLFAVQGALIVFFRVLLFHTTLAAL